jgi:hypothetical protein
MLAVDDFAEDDDDLEDGDGGDGSPLCYPCAHRRAEQQ